MRGGGEKHIVIQNKNLLNDVEDFKKKKGSIVKKILFLTCSVFLALFIANGVNAFSVDVDDLFKLSRGPGSGPGGAFKVDVLGKGSDFDFFTFCVEMNEYINFSDTFRVAALSYTTNAGGKTITEQTAWLYHNALNNTLSGYTYNNSSHNNELQNTIWKSIGYNVLVGDLGTGWLTASNNLIGTKNFYGVQVANLVYAINGYKAQDQLVKVPEPGTMLLLGIGLLGIAIVSRRKFNNLTYRID